jgi:hypothetical protein
MGNSKTVSKLKNECVRNETMGEWTFKWGTIRYESENIGLLSIG